MSSALFTTAIAAALFLGFRPSAVAAPVRVSFLTEPAALQEALTVLQSGGCESEALDIFQRAVERYTSSPFEIDLSRFPKPRDGFYTFNSASAAVAALPHPLCDTAHPYEFNCFDTVIALVGDALLTSVRPDDLASPFWVPFARTNGSFTILPRATAREAFELAYPDWYRAAADKSLPKSRDELRIALTAVLFRCHLLPQSATETGLKNAVMAALRASWERDKVVFPHQCEVVLAHQVSFRQRWFVTVHAGLLISRKDGFTYVEKAGGSGPFVRLDFKERIDLRIWLGGMFRGAERQGYTHHFATFNDTGIEILEVPKKQAARR